METRKKRLQLFISLVYEGNKSALKRDIEKITNIEMSNQNYQFLINKETVNDEFKDCLFKLGLNINWYLYNKGEMYAENIAGKKLKEKFLSAGNYEIAVTANLASDKIESYKPKKNILPENAKSEFESNIEQRLIKIEGILEQLAGKEIDIYTMPAAAGKIKQRATK